MIGLLFTLLCGLSFLIGIFIFSKSKNKIAITRISIACAFIVIIGLIIFDLIPELIEIGKWWLWVVVFIGLISLIIIDHFVPHHTHKHKYNDEVESEHQHHIFHISFLTIIALLLHNIVEGVALYSLSLVDWKSGLYMCLGISLHNLPFGFQIASYTVDKNNNKMLIVLLVLSSFFGGLLTHIIGSISEYYLSIVIALTLGMILHILLFELLKEVTTNLKQKDTIYGIIIGILLIIVMNFI